MLIGNGFIANKFDEYKNNDEFIIFASGVSNSKETRKEEFDKEIDILCQKIKKYGSQKCFVYFSTCSVYDNQEINSHYVKHKINIEKILIDSVKHFHIFRVSQVVGKSKNKFTILNFIYNCILNEIKFDLWLNVYRNLIDIDDLYLIVNYIISNNLLKNRIINIANKQNISIVKIVEIFEKILKKKAIYNIVKIDSNYYIDIAEIENIIKILNVEFDNHYAERIIYKYYKS